MRPVPRAPLVLALFVLWPADAGARPPPRRLAWSTVVNNGTLIPTDTCDPAAPDPAACRTFNSYNPPSVNVDGLVAFRARSRGGQGGEPVHGVYTRDMPDDGPVRRILDRETVVPQPNELGATFAEPPSFPRIDAASDTVVTRGNHPPVWESVGVGGETVERVGTSGIYTNPFGDVITGASKLGSIDAFSFFEVPGLPGTPFDVFPGAPSVADGTTLVFKGNFTDEDLVARTGVYFRELDDAPIPGPDGALLEPAGGTNPIVRIADSRETLIPGTSTLFGSTAPPSAAGGRAVFSGFDDEEDPALGGIFLAPLDRPDPPLQTLVAIGDPVPGQPPSARFARLGEALSFDGRFVAFWGAWGDETRHLVLQCPTEGNAERIAFCLDQHPDGFGVEVPVNQGIFVHDTVLGRTRAIATTPRDFDDFLYWNFSGRVPGTDEDGELARWRSAAFVAVSGWSDGRPGRDVRVDTAFEARSGEVVDGAWVNPVDGIYLADAPGSGAPAPLVETGMEGTRIDPDAVDPDTGAPLPITELGIERDGFRAGTIVINARMGTEESGWAGIYLTEVAR